MQTKHHFNPVKSVYTLSFAALGACWGAAKVNYSFYDVDVFKLRTKVRTPPQLGEVCYCAFVFVI